MYEGVRIGFESTSATPQLPSSKTSFRE